VDNSSEPSLALDDGIWDAHLAAERRQEYDKLDRVDIVRNQNECSFLVLNKADYMIQTVLGRVGFLADVLLLLALLDRGSLLVQALLLLGRGLRSVLVEQLERLGSCVLVEDVLELRDGRGHLQAHGQDLLLALEADIFGPLHHAREVALGLDVLADTEVSRSLLEERVL
jgi:hypothetical protein